jgi:hypothetical protein
MIPKLGLHPLSLCLAPELRALHELLKPRPAVGRFIVVGGEAAGASHRRCESGQRHEHEHEKHHRDVANDLYHRQREPWNAKRPR